jgi:DNA-binding transcriptional regulator YhcF (GntR family)/AcrR family transcriptional regulator
MSAPDEPRYRQVVAELQHRIESGELTPGARVPSTRQITRQWNVAMATATKVLADLQQQGLVHAVPGVGTVVSDTLAGGAEARGPRISSTAEPTPSAGPAPRPGTAEQVLSVERIVAAAIQVADAEGLGAVSMRRVATEIAVATMSLYRHVDDKDDLLIRMMSSAFSEWPFPAEPPPGWRERLELAGRMLWSMFRAHPWLAPALSLTRPQAIASALPFTEWVLLTLDREGLDAQTIFTTHLTLFNYIRATAVNLELEAEAEADSGLDNEQWMDAQQPAMDAIVSSGRFPTFERLAARGYDFNLDELFEFGLQRLLDGIAVMLADRPG